MSDAMQLAHLVLVAAVAGSATCSHQWNYNTSDGVNGPGRWKDEFPACGGAGQTPIHVMTKGTGFDDDLKPFIFAHYDDDVALFNITSNGDRVKLIPFANPPKISGAGLPSNYSIKHVHFHWGENNSIGSEHKIDDGVYAGEVHFVHANDKYNVSEAFTKSDGVAVISVLLKAGGPTHPDYQRIFDHIAEIGNEGDTIPFGRFQLKKLLPSDVSSYYRFHGSRDVPPCTEVVTWSLLTEAVTLSDDQFAQLRTFRNGDVEIKRNYRPIQPTNARPVTRSWRLSNESGTTGRAASAHGRWTATIGGLALTSALAAVITWP